MTPMTMKDTCLDLEPLLALRADDELDAAQTALVDRHLEACPSCRAAAEAQQAVRDLVVARAANLRDRAPEALRQRVAAQAAPRTRRPAWSPLRLPVAATLLLTMFLWGTYALTSASTTVLAAQLALDHLKCVKLVQDGEGLDSAEAQAEWVRTYAWSPAMPDAKAEDGTKLIGVRRCLYGHGHLAHLLYTVNGRVVSLFVMPRADHEASDEATVLALFGQQARVWTAGEQTFALVTDADAAGLDRLERQFRSE